MSIKLYQFERCPYCTKVRGTLEAKGVEYEKIEVSLDREERTELFELSGQYMVPVLVDGDTIIQDSSAILDYLNDKY